MIAFGGVQLFVGVLGVYVGVTGIGSSCCAVTYDEIMRELKAVVCGLGCALDGLNSYYCCVIIYGVDVGLLCCIMIGLLSNRMYLPSLTMFLGIVWSAKGDSFVLPAK